MKIRINAKTYHKIMHWVNKADFEVSGFGKVIYQNDEFIVTDAILLKQSGGSAHTDIEPESLSKAQYELRDVQGDLRFWWHSHVKMNAFMSAQDKRTIQDIGEQGWCVAAVFNQRNEYETAIGYVFETPFGGRQVHYQEKLPLVIDYGITESEVKQWDVDFEAHVTKEKPISITSRFANLGNGVIDMSTQGTLLTKEDDDYWTEEDEARALGVSVKKYRKMLKNATSTELAEMDDKIHRYMADKYGWNWRGYADTRY